MYRRCCAARGRTKSRSCSGDVSLDLPARKAFKNGTPVVLTPQEFELLQILVLNRNIALSRSRLLELAWGFDYYGDTRTVDVHIQKLPQQARLGRSNQDSIQNRIQAGGLEA